MKNSPDGQIKDEKHSDSGGLGIRHVITVILCSCLAVNYILRVNLSVAVVVMTDANRTDGHVVFDWTPEQKGMLLSSFFTGYLVSNVVAGYFVTKYSNKKLLLMSVTYSTVASLVTPFLVNWGGFYAMFMIRVSMGLVQGFMMPVAQGLLSKWIPPFERSRCGSIVIGGTHLGTIVSFVSSGFLGDSPGGWPSIFYFSGLLSGVWCLLWYWYGADHPDSCTRITERERLFINHSLSGASTPDTAKKAIPWKLILTNKAVYALMVDMIGQNWGYWILVTQIPSYFAHVLHFDTSKNGTLAALPFICVWLVSFPVSFLSDYLISRNILTITSARKVFNSIGQWGVAVALVFLAYPPSVTSAVAAYTIGVSMIAFTFVGFMINVLDLAPNYAGLLMGLTNGVSHITAICGPAFVGFVVKPVSEEGGELSTKTLQERIEEDTKGVDNVEGWKLVFLVAAFLFFLGNLIYIIFGSGEIQDFNNVDDSKSEKDAEKSEKEPLKS